MDEITIKLAEQQFSDGITLFNDQDVKLSHKNFIFAKNGSGKSTFASLAKQQLAKDYDVSLYDGFESMLGANENLNAFALSIDANKNEMAIREKQKELYASKKELESVEKDLGNTDSNDFVEGTLNGDLQAKKNEVEEEKKEQESFFTESAAKIKNMSNPQISAPTYNKNNFKKELSFAKRLQDSEVEQLKETIGTDERIVGSLIVEKIDFAGYLQSVNEILQSKVEEKTHIVRFNNEQEKINFAQRGLELHKHEEGEICIFCGNVISKSTFDELESYFSADEVAKLEERIHQGKELVADTTNSIKKLEKQKSDFYPEFRIKATELWQKIQNQKEKILEFCNSLEMALNEKDRNLFSELVKLDIPVPDNIDALEYNDLVKKNNEVGANLNSKREQAKNQLRYHFIKGMLDSFGYEAKSNVLITSLELQANAQRQVDQKNKQKHDIEKLISSIELEIKNLKPKAEEQAVEHINQKLRGSVKWQLEYYKNNESGYYWVSEKCSDGNIVHRGVKELSTGEKNIIALLYFLEKLENTEQISKQPKLIIFDDPMNSNDADMQYLIITELQKLYQGTYSKKCNPQKDFIIIMTHNIHFYLNVPPYGSYEDKNGKTKYDKNNFYHIRRGRFIKIKNQKEDFKTNYDALWSELQDLAKAGFRNSMLNSMRRIIDTYIDFTRTKPDTFYQGDEKYRKLFNVNSHEAIDDLSAEAFTESAEELVNEFYQIFLDNNAEDHFKAHWKMP